MIRLACRAVARLRGAGPIGQAARRIRGDRRSRPGERAGRS